MCLAIPLIFVYSLCTFLITHISSLLQTRLVHSNYPCYACENIHYVPIHPTMNESIQWHLCQVYFSSCPGVAHKVYTKLARFLSLELSMQPMSAYQTSFLLLLFISMLFFCLLLFLFLSWVQVSAVFTGRSVVILKTSSHFQVDANVHVLSFGGFWHWIYSGQCTCNIFLKAGVETGKSLLSCACVTCQRSTEEHREDVALPDCYTSMSLTCFSRQV